MNLAGNFQFYATNVDSDVLKTAGKLLRYPIYRDLQSAFFPNVNTLGSRYLNGLAIDTTSIAIPGLLGAGIGNGIRVAKLGVDADSINLNKVDSIIRERISITSLREKPYYQTRFHDIRGLQCYQYLSEETLDQLDRSMCVLGKAQRTFVEIDADSYGEAYLVVQTGDSRIAKEVFNFYDTLSKDTCAGHTAIMAEGYALQEDLIYNSDLPKEEITTRINAFYENASYLYGVKTPKHLAFLTCDEAKSYFRDVRLCEDFCSVNRFNICNEIKTALGISLEDTFDDQFDNVQVGISPSDQITRVGAISAHNNEKVAITLGPREGILIGFGKGNHVAMDSAPCGARRTFSDKELRKNKHPKYNMNMRGIHVFYPGFDPQLWDAITDPAMYDTSDFERQLSEFITVHKHLKPIYNFKPI